MPSAEFIALSTTVEAFTVLIVAGLLLVMNRNLGYDYQKYWALSWFAYAVYLTLVSVTLYSQFGLFDLNMWKFSISMLIQLFGYLKIYFLLLGTLVMCGKMTPDALFHALSISLIVLISILVCSLHSGPDMWAARYFTRISARMLILGAVSFYCAYLIYKYVEGQSWAKLFAICLVIHACAKQVYVVQGVYFLLGEQPDSWTRFFALVDIPLQAFLAFGLVGWAIQNEHKIAMHDSLTGLPNRLWLEKHFDKHMSKLSKDHKRAAFIFIDIDGFKAVNDSFGHDTGDALLKEISKCLKITVRQTDMICRLGGDEFVWVLPTSEDGPVILDRAEQFRKIIESIGSINNHKISISCSMGISWYSEQQPELKTLIRQSDRALYTAKKQGKNRVVAFT